MITYVSGDLLKKFAAKEFDAIAQGCNCFHAMASGIAPQIRLAHIEAYKADMTSNFGDPTKLGEFTYAKVDNGLIFNLYTQYRPGGQDDLDQLYANIRAAFKRLNTVMVGKTIGIPKIGCGIAGGDWKVVEKIIDEVTPDLNIVVVNYDPEAVNLFDL